MDQRPQKQTSENHDTMYGQSRLENFASYLIRIVRAPDTAVHHLNITRTISFEFRSNQAEQWSAFRREQSGSKALQAHKRGTDSRCHRRRLPFLSRVFHQRIENKWKSLRGSPSTPRPTFLLVQDVRFRTTSPLQRCRHAAYPEGHSTHKADDSGFGNESSSEQFFSDAAVKDIPKLQFLAKEGACCEFFDEQLANVTSWRYLDLGFAKNNLTGSVLLSWVSKEESTDGIPKSKEFLLYFSQGFSADIWKWRDKCLK